jgi:hypothetical protein
MVALWEEGNWDTEQLAGIWVDDVESTEMQLD